MTDKNKYKCPWKVETSGAWTEEDEYYRMLDKYEEFDYFEEEEMQ